MGEEGRVIVVARCGRCHGWTMWHADAKSPTGIEWTAQARRDGDLITTYDPSTELQLGKPCPDAKDKAASERSCPVKWVESTWSPYQ